MERVVLDTGVSSLSLRRRLPPQVLARLVGKESPRNKPQVLAACQSAAWAVGGSRRRFVRLRAL